MAEHSSSSPEALIAQHTLSRRRLIRAAAAWLLLPVIPRRAQAATILAVRVWPAEEYTRVTLELDSELKTKQFTLDYPHRLVVDIEGLSMSPSLQQLPAKIRTKDPYIRSLRIAQNRPNLVRLVFDLKQAIAPQIFTLKPVANYKYRLVLDLYPKIAQDPIMALLKKSPTPDSEDPLARILEDLARHSPGANTAKSADPRTRSREIDPNQVLPQSFEPASKFSGRKRILTIVLDPGHGGEDPGAQGRSGLREKDVVLRIAHRLKALIDGQPSMRAYLTRDGDYFVPLHVRVQKARRVQADLFVSIHADAWVKSSASGSSVFVLSPGGASSNAARWLANKENAADLIGGVNLAAHDAQLAKVLFDLSTSAQIHDSLKLGAAFLEEIKKINRLHKDNVEQAGFAVLKAPDIPSILVETAFISNPDEEALLKSNQHQSKLATAMFKGIRRYLTTHPALARNGNVN